MDEKLGQSTVCSALGAVRFERACGFVAWTLPFGSALVRSSSLAQWQGDVGAVRDITLAGTGWGAGLTTNLTQALLLLPLGSQSLRAAMLSTLALALFSWLVFRVAARALRSQEATLGLPSSAFAAPAFALIAALLTSLSPTLQLEATAGGTSLVGAAVALAVIDRLMRPRGDRPALHFAETSLLVGLGFAENAVVTLTALAAGLVFAWSTVMKQRAHSRLARVGGAVFVFAAVVVSLPGIVRCFAPNVAIGLGGPFLWGPVLPGPTATIDPVLSSFSGEAGWVACASAALGVVFSVKASRGRSLLRAIVLVGLVDVLLLGAVGPTAGSLAVRALSFALLGCLVVVGAFAGLAELVKRRIPFARAAAAMTVAVHLTVLALVSEQAQAVANRAEQRGADAFTEVALDGLPPRALVLVSDPRVAWRLLAAQEVEGRRPDVLIIPRDLIDRGKVAASVLTWEPRADSLLRTLALEVSSDEFSLSQLADTRPLFVVPEPGWDSGIYDHLSPKGVWLEFDSEPKSPLERKFDVDATLVQISALTAIARDPRADPGTRQAVNAVATTQAKLLLRVGQADSALDYLARVNIPDVDSREVTRSLDVMFASTVSRLPSTTELRANKKSAKKKSPKKSDAPPLFRKPRRSADQATKSESTVH